LKVVSLPEGLSRIQFHAAQQVKGQFALLCAEVGEKHFVDRFVKARKVIQITGFPGGRPNRNPAIGIVSPPFDKAMLSHSIDEAGCRGESASHEF
jgi:hypothetical protein